MDSNKIIAKVKKMDNVQPVLVSAKASLLSFATVVERPDTSVPIVPRRNKFLTLNGRSIESPMLCNNQTI